jgi:putative flippase GtrA
MKQFLSYLGSGVTALVLAMIAYKLMIVAGVWFVTASVISDGIGLVLVFVLNKYLVFDKPHHTPVQAVRYGVVQVLNTLVQAGIVYLLVRYSGSEEVLAKSVSIAVCVPVNYWAYKHVVYI